MLWRETDAMNEKRKFFLEALGKEYTYRVVQE
jgi:hypothetical protein